MERCHYPGSISHGTRGEGPWYCRHHFFCADQSEGGKIVAEARKWNFGELVPNRARPVNPRAQAQEEPGALG